MLRARRPLNLLVRLLDRQASLVEFGDSTYFRYFAEKFAGFYVDYAFAVMLYISTGYE